MTTTTDQRTPVDFDAIWPDLDWTCEDACYEAMKMILDVGHIVKGIGNADDALLDFQQRMTAEGWADAKIKGLRAFAIADSNWMGYAK